MGGRSWNAQGLLLPLWEKIPGKRDELARRTGIGGTTLSAYNSGARNLGIANARRIAAALDVSVLELGASEEAADERGRTLLARLGEHERQTAADLVKLRTDLAAAIRRIRALERQAAAGARGGSGSAR